VYIGVTDFKTQNSDLPRQKINGIYQYKNTTHVVCVMSYGYVAVVDIDVNGMNDVSFLNILYSISFNILEIVEYYKNSQREHIICDIC
jgi:hypothetical protein